MGKHSVALNPPVALTGLADALFTPVQQRVLGLLFGQPDRRFQSGELIRLASMSSPELENLARTGKLKREPPTDAEIAGLLAWAA